MHSTPQHMYKEPLQYSLTCCKLPWDTLDKVNSNLYICMQGNEEVIETT